MAKLREDLKAQVETLRSAVTKRQYVEAIALLKEIGGEVGAFATMHAALVAATAGAGFGVGLAAASLGPFGAGVVFIAGVGTISTGYAVASQRLNQWYDDLDTVQRQALTRAIAYGIGKSRLLLRAWKVLTR